MLRVRLPINAENYFLITKNGKKSCEDNSKLKCRTMKASLADKEVATCTSCYTELGYMSPSPKTKMCLMCTELNCVECMFADNASDAL